MGARVLEQRGRLPAVQKVAEMRVTVPAPASKARAAVRRPELSKLSEPCRFCAARDQCDAARLMTMMPEPVTATQLSLRSFSRGESVFCEGDRLKSVYFIRSGSVRISLGNPAGDEQVTGFHLSGDQLGLDALYGEKIHRTSAVTLENTDVCAIPAVHIEWIIGHVPGAMGWLLGLTGDSIMQCRNLFLMINKMDSEARLRRFLLDLSERMQQRGCSPSEFTLPMSRKDIGNHLGMAVETVSRLMTRFQREGLLQVIDRRRVMINDSQRFAVR